MIKINEERLWQRMMEMAKIGATSKGGVNRVALSDEDKAGRDLFIAWCKAANCTIEIDNMGNLFAKRAGKDNSEPTILIGSHLDSQPTGGKYDGVYGVLAALEVIETLNDQNIITESPIVIVSWTNEEGARFAPAMIGSGIFADVFTLEYAYSRKDNEGKTLGNELERIGYKGTDQPNKKQYKASFEVHIEQGPILEAEEKQVGIVTGVQGIRWYDLTITGKETHAGPSPMSYRKDPMKAALPLLQKVYAIADKFAPEAKVTIGYANASPGVRNTVPGKLDISLDLRHPDEAILKQMDEQLQAIAQENQQDGIRVNLNEIWYSPPVVFDENCIAAVEKATKDLDISARKMVSGAGHDSVYIVRKMPTSMIFIPCEDGLSHNELEHAEQEDVYAGANVLLHTVLNVNKY